MQYYKVVSRLF